MLTEMIADQGRTDFVAQGAMSYWADSAMGRRHYGDALARYAEDLRRMRGTQLHNVLLQCFGIAAALAGLGCDSDAIELMAGVRAVGEHDGAIDIPEDLAPGSGDLLAASRARLGDEAVAQARARGRARSLDDLVSWALSMPEAV
jgi:hypothetical protein